MKAERRFSQDRCVPSIKQIGVVFFCLGQVHVSTGKTQGVILITNAKPFPIGFECGL